MIRILSIDGGGIRGLIPALVLAHVEERVGRPVASRFDLVAGTSTGGILALGLTCPGEDGRPRYRARDLAALYVEEGPSIFRRSWRHRIRSLYGLAEEAYPRAGLDRALRRFFGDARLSAATSEVFVTAYDIERNRAVRLGRFRARRDPGWDFRMRDAARATAAAPTFFEPALLRARDGEARTFVDGGMFANNPAGLALAYAKRLFPSAPDFLLVSLGTGTLTRPLSYGEAARFGAVRWLGPAFRIFMHGQSDSVDRTFRAGLPGIVYCRIDGPLTIASDAIDDAGPENLKALRLQADEIIDREGRRLEALCRRLAA